MKTVTRAGLLAGATALLTGALLTSCSATPTTFHLVGATPWTSEVVAGQQQLANGDYTFAADTTADPADLQWVVTSGATAASATAQPVTTLDGAATLSVTFAAPATTNIYYRVCVSSLASSAAAACQIYEVAGYDLWNAAWALPGSGGIAGFVATQTGQNVTFALFSPQGQSPVPTTLVGPFVLHITPPGGTAGFAEWTDSTTMTLIGPNGPQQLTRIP